jgi:uridine kinase
VAQLDRASVFGTEGYRFESCRAYHSREAQSAERPCHLSKKYMKPFLIGLGGDSGSGKNTLGKLLKSFIGEENLLTISMDAYHKWDRENFKKQALTHLNPEANNLDIAYEQLHDLSKGKDIDLIVYDHSTGKFTEAKKTSPQKFVLITGLHPYHLKEMRDLFDFKLFAAPDEDIRKKWKIHRDVKKRGYEKEEVLDFLAKRKADSVGYIKAQEQYADLVINYFEISDAEEVHDMELGVSLIFRHDPKSDLKLLSKSLTEKNLSATLKGKALTLTGNIKNNDISNLANTFFDNNQIFTKTPEWESNMKGVFQLLSALEINRRYNSSVLS